MVSSRNHWHAMSQSVSLFISIVMVSLLEWIINFNVHDFLFELLNYADGLHKHFHLNFIGGSKALEIAVQQTKSSRVAIPVSRQKVYLLWDLIPNMPHIFHLRYVFLFIYVGSWICLNDLNVDEFEQWLLEADIDSDYEEMGDAENNDEMVVICVQTRSHVFIWLYVCISIFVYNLFSG